MKLASPYFLILPLALGLSPTPALAQSNNSANATGSSQHNPAVNTGNMSKGQQIVPASQLAKGANSFTQGEAKARLERAGLKNVTDLKKDSSGIWRGKAMRDGKSVTVGLDFKGDIAAE